MRAPYDQAGVQADGDQGQCHHHDAEQHVSLANRIRLHVQRAHLDVLVGEGFGVRAEDHTASLETLLQIVHVIHATVVVLVGIAGLQDLHIVLVVLCQNQIGGRVQLVLVAVGI